MSVTFFLASQEVLYPACPACKGTMARNPSPDPECQHPECSGYGPDAICNTPWLNVSNVNAYGILSRLLRIETSGELFGVLEPEQVLHGLATEREDMSDLFSEEQVAGYAETLRRIAIIAGRRREMINFG